MLGERYFHCQGSFRSTEFYEISSRSLFSPTVSIYNNVNEVAIALSRTVFFRDLFHVLSSWSQALSYFRSTFSHRFLSCCFY